MINLVYLPQPLWLLKRIQMSIGLATTTMDVSIERCMEKIVHILCCGPLGTEDDDKSNT